MKGRDFRGMSAGVFSERLLADAGRMSADLKSRGCDALEIQACELESNSNQVPLAHYTVCKHTEHLAGMYDCELSGNHAKSRRTTVRNRALSGPFKSF